MRQFSIHVKMYNKVNNYWSKYVLQHGVLAHTVNSCCRYYFKNDTTDPDVIKLNDRLERLTGLRTNPHQADHLQVQTDIVGILLKITNKDRCSSNLYS